MSAGGAGRPGWERAAYSPVVDRPPVRWPERRRLAVWVAPNLEHYELTPPRTSPDRDPWPRVPHPDVQQYAYRDYGNRVGLWRFLDVCDELGVRCTVSLNLAVLDHFPEVAAAITERAWPIMCHGFYNTRYSYQLSEAEERAWLAEAVATVREHTGQELRGLLGPSISATVRTPDLMAEAGLTYHADWGHDDVPTPLTVRRGRLISMPYSFELNDVPLFAAHHDGAYLVEIAKRQFDVLYREGAAGGRVMCLALHPYLMGQPHMIGHLREVLRYVSAHDDVWMTTADEIAAHYLEHAYDAEVAYTDALAASWPVRGC